MRASSCCRYPRSERVPPLILRLITTWRRLRSAALLSDGTVRFGHEDEEFLDVALDAPAQPALQLLRVVQEGLAEGQQPPLQGQLRGAPSLGLRMGERL